MDSPVLPACLARIQRMSRPHTKESTALKIALDTPCRKWFAYPARDLFKSAISSPRSW